MLLFYGKNSMKISNSQIMDFQKCPRRFYYAQKLRLRPRDYPEPLQRGLDGHNMFEAYFNKMKAGGTESECIEAANDVLNLLIMAGRPGFAMEIYRHVIAFGAHAHEMPWEIVEVEHNYFYDLPDEDLTFCFTPDLIIRWTKGLYKGQLEMFDFKFTGQFWNANELGTYQQVPKYIRYYNLMHGTNMRRGSVVQLNTRASKSATGSQLFRVSKIPISKDKLDRIQWENERLMRLIQKAKTENDVDDWLRTVDSYQCKMCFFADICAMELNGNDASKTMNRAYVINTYFEENYGTETA